MENEAGNRLSIRKVGDETCVVSFFTARDNQPIQRPWYAAKLSVAMVATYRPEDGPDLLIELWEKGMGFTLHLNFEAAYILDDAERDTLVPALSRYEEDDFLDQYSRYFAPLKHYPRRTSYVRRSRAWEGTSLRGRGVVYASY